MTVRRRQQWERSEERRARLMSREDFQYADKVSRVFDAPISLGNDLAVPVAPRHHAEMCRPLSASVSRSHLRSAAVAQPYKKIDNVSGPTLCNWLPPTVVDQLPGGPKMAQFFGTPQLHDILTDFQNYFIISQSGKKLIILPLRIPPHLKCVATIPCEMSSVLKATTENKTTIVAFKRLHISQGRVATRLTCGGIFSDSIITNFPVIQTVK